MAELDAGEFVTHLHRDRFGTPVHVRCCEAQQAEAGANEAILAAVVINHSIPVIAAVIFDGQALTAIKQVWTA